MVENPSITNESIFHGYSYIHCDESGSSPTLIPPGETTILIEGADFYLYPTVNILSFEYLGEIFSSNLIQIDVPSSNFLDYQITIL